MLEESRLRQRPKTRPKDPDNRDTEPPIFPHQQQETTIFAFVYKAKTFNDMVWGRESKEDEHGRHASCCGCFGV